MSAKKGVFPPPLVHRWLHTGMVEVLALVGYPDGDMIRIQDPAPPNPGKIITRAWDGKQFYCKLRNVRVSQKDVDVVRTKRGSDDLTPEVLLKAAEVAWERECKERRQQALEAWKQGVRDIQRVVAADVMYSLYQAKAAENGGEHAWEKTLTRTERRRARDERRRERAFQEATQKQAE